MNITVNEQPQCFYLAFDKWQEAFGHEIRMGKYSFCAIPMENVINVTEVTSGARLYEIPVDFDTRLLTQTKEEAIQYFYTIGETVKRIIESKNNLDEELAMLKQIAFDGLGKMPEIVDVNIK